MRDLNAPNAYGVPLHATHGVRQDEHYWCYVRTLPIYKAILAHAQNT